MLGVRRGVLKTARHVAVDVASSTVEVVDMTTQSSATRAGLWPLGALSASRGGLLNDDFVGADLNALLLTVRTLPAADQGAFGDYLRRTVRGTPHGTWAPSQQKWVCS